MAIITISRGSYSKGKEIAEKVAERLGYRLLSRDVLLEASEEFNISEVKLVRALHDAPSVFNRIVGGKEKYVAWIRQTFLEQVRDDDVVYHGLAGQFFVEGVEHVLKVRIIADMEDRIRLEMEREGIGEEQARRLLEKDDVERRRWSHALYGIDTNDASLYAMVIHIRKLTVDDAVDMICTAARLPQFQATDESRQHLDDLLLASRARSLIVGKWPNAVVTGSYGEVIVTVSAPLEQEALIYGQIQELVKDVPDLGKVRLDIRPRMEF
jgi:cytidylate kinase